MLRWWSRWHAAPRGGPAKHSHQTGACLFFLCLFIVPAMRACEGNGGEEGCEVGCENKNPCTIHWLSSSSSFPFPFSPCFLLLLLCLVQVSAGRQHSLALSTSGLVFIWGRPHRSAAPIATPQIVAKLKGQRVVKVAAGDDVSFALTEDGKLWGWGSPELPQLLLCQSKAESTHTPKALATPPDLRVSSPSDKGARTCVRRDSF